MSWKATSWAQDKTTGGMSTKCVLYAIANYADEDGTCWTSQTQIADDCECSVDTVQRHYKKLEELAFLMRVRRPNKDRKRQTDIIVLCMPFNMKYWKNIDPKKLHRNLRLTNVDENDEQSEAEIDVDDGSDGEKSYTAPMRLTKQGCTAHSPKVAPQSCGVHIEAEPSLEPSLSADAREDAATDPLLDKLDEQIVTSGLSDEQRDFRKKVRDKRKAAKGNPHGLAAMICKLFDRYSAESNITKRAKKLGLKWQFEYLVYGVCYDQARGYKQFNVGYLDMRICQLGFAKVMDKAEINLAAA